MVRVELTEAAEALLLRFTDEEVGSTSEVPPVTSFTHIWTMEFVAWKHPVAPQRTSFREMEVRKFSNREKVAFGSPVERSIE